MTAFPFDGDKIALSPEQARKMAQDAMDEYDAGIRAGGEPTYPQWAANILKEPT